MLAIDRQKAILSEILSKGSITISRACKDYGVSEETIRRDLDKLAQSYPIQKVHGGAFAYQDFEKSVPMDLRQIQTSSEKVPIAECAAALVKRYDCIFLDNSNTAYHIALAAKKLTFEFTVVTNSLDIIIELGNCKNIKVICLGGTLNSRSRSFSGQAALQMLNTLIADKAFISPPNLDMKFGLTDYSSNEAQIRKGMLENSQQHILVAGHSKFDGVSTNRVSSFAPIDTLITNQSLNSAWKSFLSENSIELIIPASPRAEKP